MSIKYKVSALFTLLKNYRKLEKNNKDKKEIRRMYKTMAKKIISGDFYFYN